MKPNAGPPDDLIDLTIDAVGHGGYCVARHEGRVVLVRHTLPGERIRARVTHTNQSGRLWRADAVDILEPSPERVESRWPAAGSGGVGGGELAHVGLPAQRHWKKQVIEEQFRRLSRMSVDVTVEQLGDDDACDGLGYRTRIDLVADEHGRAGMFRHRSHEVQSLTTMPLATDQVLALAAHEEVFQRRWAPGSRLELVVPYGSDTGLFLVNGTLWHGGRFDRRMNARRTVLERVSHAGQEYRYRVAADGFWQVHRYAPAALLRHVVELADISRGASVADLYSGAGLFTAALAHVVGPEGSVLAVESDGQALRDARRNLHHLPQVQLHGGRVDHVVSSWEQNRCEVVVLDPPRQGAGRHVVTQLAQLSPEKVVYVACDPAALARDVALFRDIGYELTALKALDMFPHTHHVETLAVLQAAHASR